MDFYNLGIPIIAISTGTPASARNFIKEFKFPGRIYLDQKRTLYKVLSCKRGVKYSLSRKTLSVTRKAFEEGYKQGPNQGDMLYVFFYIFLYFFYFYYFYFYFYFVY